MKLSWTLLLLISVSVAAQKQAVIDSYIEQYRQYAIEEQVRTGIPAAITMAQAIHESGAGQGDLALRSNNHFGIKCKSNWTGAVVFHDDDSAGECFRSYESVEASFRDHSDFLRTGKRYAFLFDIPPTDYYAWASGLKQAGYATNPKYAEIISRIIEDNELDILTETALNQSGNTIWLSTASKPAGPVKGGSTTSTDAAPPANKEITFQKTISKPALATPQPSKDDVIKINRCKAVDAPAGTLLRTLATTFDIDYADLLDYNDMKPVEKLASRQLIFLERKRKKGDEKTHTVKKGESAWLISQLEGIRLERLLDYNNLKPGTKLKAGQVLKLH